MDAKAFIKALLEGKENNGRYVEELQMYDLQPRVLQQKHDKLAHMVHNLQKKLLV